MKPQTPRTSLVISSRVKFWKKFERISPRSTFHHGSSVPPPMSAVQRRASSKLTTGGPCAPCTWLSPWDACGVAPRPLSMKRQPWRTSCTSSQQLISQLGAPCFVNAQWHLMSILKLTFWEYAHCTTPSWFLTTTFRCTSRSVFSSSAQRMDGGPTPLSVTMGCSSD